MHTCHKICFRHIYVTFLKLLYYLFIYLTQSQYYEPILKFGVGGIFNTKIRKFFLQINTFLLQLLNEIIRPDVRGKEEKGLL